LSRAVKIAICVLLSFLVISIADAVLFLVLTGIHSGKIYGFHGFVRVATDAEAEREQAKSMGAFASVLAIGLIRFALSISDLPGRLRFDADRLQRRVRK
jgi:hypothetical protein